MWPRHRMHEVDHGRAIFMGPKATPAREGGAAEHAGIDGSRHAQFDDGPGGARREPRLARPRAAGFRPRMSERNMASTADVVLIVAPYDSGRREWRMGAGPRVLARAVRERLTRRGLHVHEVEVEPEGSELEIAASFQLYRRIAREAAGARAAGRLPVVLAGNCGSSLGAVADDGASPTT